MIRPDEDRPLPKRFYEKARAVRNNDGAFELRLDTRLARTPARAVFSHQSKALMAAVAAEWEAAVDVVDPARMPLTTALATVIDLGARDTPAWRGALVNYLKTDLLCYRAGAPAALVERQKAAWDPYLDWWAELTGARLAVTTGVMAVSQSGAVIDKAAAIFDALAPDALFAVKTGAELTGSAVLAAALFHRAGSPGAIFEASRVDERFQEERWGVDTEAKTREDAMRAAFEATGRFIALTAA